MLKDFIFSIPHHFILYRKLVAVQARSQLQYRVSFLFDLVSTGFITTTTFVSLIFVIQRFDGLGGWQLAEVAFLYGMVEMAFGLMDMLFSGFDPANFGRQVRLGRFDQILLRPVSVTLQVLGSEFALRRWGRILQGGAILGWALLNLSVAWTPAKLLFLPLVVTGLVAYFGSLFVVGATITFWTVESIELVNVLTYGGSEMISYPMHIYQDWMRGFFTYILPAIFLNYYPALYILGKPDPFNMPWFAPYLSPVVGLGFLAAALAFWNFGIRHYHSTGT